MTGIASKSLEKSFKCVFFCFLFVFYTYLFACIFLADVCQNYHNLIDKTRKSDYITVTPKCDDQLKPDWYRFQGAAGTKMVTECPQMGKCDTDFPIWLKEDHPTADEGKVRREVCIHRAGNCCYEGPYFINVKNCSSYYIYNLFDQGVCNARYCSTD